MLALVGVQKFDKLYNYDYANSCVTFVCEIDMLVTVVSKDEEDRILDLYEKTKDLNTLTPLLNSCNYFIEKEIVKSKYDIPGYDKEDLRQEIYLEICQNIDHFDRTKGFRFITYFTDQFIYRCLDKLRRKLFSQKRTPELTLPLNDDTCDELESNSGSPEECCSLIEDCIAEQERIARLNNTKPRQITSAQLREMKTLHDQGVSKADLSRQYKRHWTTIHSALRRIESLVGNK